MAPAVSAPAARPNANPGPNPRPRASAGAVTAVAPTVATVAKIANAFFIRVSSIDYPRNNADVFRWLQRNQVFGAVAGNRRRRGTCLGLDRAKDKENGVPKNLT